jgi:RNA polymerase primary sigma factor
MSEVQVERCLSAVNQKCMSLDQEISNAFKPNNGAREGSTLAEIVESRTEDEDHAHQKQKMLREALVETLHRHLEPDEVELLLLRFGLRSGDQLSIAKLSRVVGLKPDSVRRRIGTCLHRLRAIGVEEWLAFERELL